MAACPLFGFDVALRVAAGLSDAKASALLGDFVRAVESRGLRAGGAAHGTHWTFTVEPESGQAIDADREAVAAWAAARREFVDVAIGELIDLNGAM